MYLIDCGFGAVLLVPVNTPGGKPISSPLLLRLLVMCGAGIFDGVTRLEAEWGCSP